MFRFIRGISDSVRIFHGEFTDTKQSRNRSKVGNRSGADGPPVDIPRSVIACEEWDANFSRSPEVRHPVSDEQDLPLLKFEPLKNRSHDLYFCRRSPPDLGKE